jgi:hypothetical protein
MSMKVSTDFTWKVIPPLGMSDRSLLLTRVTLPWKMVTHRGK